MTDWFRSWHGAPTDPKWLGIARRAGVAPGIAVAVAWALMDRASQAEDRGDISGYDPDGLACFYGCEPEQVDAIVNAMNDKGILVNGRFANWEKRQPIREDDSLKRVREHRERKRNDAERSVTQCNAPDTDTDTDTSSLRSEEKEKARERDENSDFEKWFSSWPSYASDDEATALQSWLALPPDERLLAVKSTAAYVAAAKGGGRTAIVPANKYLDRKLWMRVKAQGPPKAPAAAITNAAKFQSREDYIKAELARAERSFQR